MPPLNTRSCFSGSMVPGNPRRLKDGDSSGRDRACAGTTASRSAGAASLTSSTPRNAGCAPTASPENVCGCVSAGARGVGTLAKPMIVELRADGGTHECYTDERDHELG